MKGLETVLRARSQLGLGIRYYLGYGGKDPSAENCGEPGKIRKWLRFCDCSGFVAYSLGIPRRAPGFPTYGGWISTDSMIDEARSAGQWFKIVSKPEIGDVIVYGGIDLDLNGKRDRVGHTGIVSRVRPGYSLFRDLDVIHCSSSLGVAETRGTLWEGKDTFRRRNNPKWGSLILRFQRNS